MDVKIVLLSSEPTTVLTLIDSEGSLKPTVGETRLELEDQPV
jgi:hypothetical protein